MGGAIPGSLRRLDDADSALLLGVLRRQADAQAIYPLSYDAVRAIAGIKHLSQRYRMRAG